MIGNMHTFSELVQATMPLATLTAAAQEAMQISPSMMVGIVVFILVGIAVVLALIVLIIVAQWKVYKKMGHPGWVAIVPFYNTVIQLRMTNLPLWWVVLLFVPIVNIVLFVLITRRLAGVFGRSAGFTVGLIFLPFIFYPILGFGRAIYHNGYPPARPMSEEVKWALIGAGVFAICFFNGSTPSRLHPLVRIADSEYATDGEYVYLNNEMLSGADPRTFKIDGYYAKDAWSVYYDADRLSGVDASHFTVLGERGVYAKSDTDVYCAGMILEGADVATFSIFSDDDFAKDSTRVYVDCRTLRGVDSKTFEVLGGGYAKGAAHVYYYHQPILGADLKTFTVESGMVGTDEYDAKDKNHMYYAGELMGEGSVGGE